MDYAKKSLGLLSPSSISKCVSASASMTQQLLSSPAPRARPFRVCNWDRSLRKGIMAESLADLLGKIQSTLLLVGTVAVVLDEDGTMVETEEFFQTLEDGTVLMALGKGQTWASAKTPGYQLLLSRKPRRRIDVACVTFDLYKTSPQDLGCLNVKATLYGTYSMSYDLHCYGAKRLMKEALRWTLFTMQATGHVLLGSSCYVQQLLDATEEQKEKEEREGGFLKQQLLPLPTRKMLQ
ncbi:lipid transferase CIDEC [Alligator mississippiensis]|uniref:lipid transferase CIDEC n=1 Tax=Alligator mississippiensis TaxID=8496 RepID=UPI002877DB64|nr:lipid transferase CIDEC [Alligator mississippiensis]XP_019346703.2 lipid transferase CIDEC [Alligator mississippiensis]